MYLIIKLKETFRKCLRSLNYNEDGSRRVNFPKKKLRNITQDFLEIINVIQVYFR